MIDITNLEEWEFFQNNSMSKHIELAIETNPDWAEYLADIIITEFSCAGVVTGETEYRHDEIIKTSSKVKCYFWVDESNPFNFEKIKEVLRNSRQNLVDNNVNENCIGSWDATYTEVIDEDWAHNWKKYWHPQKITDKIVISPSWEEYNISEDEILINLDPGIAFGTGTHPTTKLCIKAIEDHIKQGNVVADVGMGSGILAIVAAKLGAQQVIGVDNDPSVISVAKDNANINEVLDLCNFYEGVSTDIKGQYDLVVSNILAEVLIEIMETFVPLVKQNGKLILSGIIERKADAVRETAEKFGFNHINTTHEGDWVAIILEKK